MPFSESIKKEVREKAAFRCCRCQNIGVQVHHIIPQKDGGDDSMDNAAPLCPNCHDNFGDNPRKRKQITEMRNWWYSQVSNMFQSRFQDIQKLENRIDTLVLTVQKQDEKIESLREVLNEHISQTSGFFSKQIPELEERNRQLVANITVPTSAYIASTVVNSVYPDFIKNDSWSVIK